LGKDDERERPKPRYRSREPRQSDEQVDKAIADVQAALYDKLEPAIITSLNGFQRKQVYRFFEKTCEFKVKAVRENDDYILKVYPLGQLRRIAEQKTQLVLMNGKPESLPPMDSYERFLIHDYLKDRDGVKTESSGVIDKDRHVEIHPIFGRTKKKKKKRRLI